MSLAARLSANIEPTFFAKNDLKKQTLLGMMSAAVFVKGWHLMGSSFHQTLWKEVENKSKHIFYKFWKLKES